MFNIAEDEDRVPEILFDGKVHVWHMKWWNKITYMQTQYYVHCFYENRIYGPYSLDNVSLVLFAENGPQGKWLTVKYNKHRNTNDVDAAMYNGFGEYETIDVGYLYYKRNPNA